MTISKYLIRSIKYLIYFVLVFGLIVSILYLLELRKTPDLPITSMFQEGSLIKIVIFFVVIAAVYPAIGFATRRLHLDMPFDKSESIVVGAMENLGFIVESQTEKEITFRVKKAGMRASRMWEDRITMKLLEDDWVSFEGYRKDLQRVLSAVAYAIYKVKNPEEE